MPRPDAIARRLGTCALFLAVSAGFLGAQQDPDQVADAAARHFFSLCRDVPPDPNTGVLFGVVEEAATRTPLNGADVTLTVPVIGDDGRVGSSQIRAGTDELGQYAFCNVPRDTRIGVRAETLGRTSLATSIMLGGSSMFTRHDLPIFLTRVYGAVQGRIVDAETLEAIPAATARVEDLGYGVLSDDTGRFRLDQMPPGDVEITFSHVAYGDQSVTVQVVPGSNTAVEFRISQQAIEMAPIAVTIDTRPQWLENVGFYHRLETGLGEFLTPIQVERRQATRFSELLRSIPGIIWKKACVPHCYYVLEMSTNQRLTACTPTFYVDGQKAWQPDVVDLDAIASAFDVAAIEVYRGISQTPAQFFGQCGAIVVWTKRGSAG